MQNPAAAAPASDSVIQSAAAKPSANNSVAREPVPLIPSIPRDALDFADSVTSFNSTNSIASAGIIPSTAAKPSVNSRVGFAPRGPVPPIPRDALEFTDSVTSTDSIVSAAPASAAPAVSLKSSQLSVKHPEVCLVCQYLSNKRIEIMTKQNTFVLQHP